MSFTRPTLSELVTLVQGDFVSRLELQGAVLRRSMVAVMSRVVAGTAHMLHGHLDYLSKQLFPDSSDDAFLVRQASLFGLTKTDATYAKGTVDVAGTDDTVIPAGTLLVRSDGATYSTDADATIASEAATIAITAELAGADGTLDAGVVLSFESPISGIDSTATVDSSTEDGTDQESTDALRERLLERMGDDLNGGTEDDYVAWAKEVAGVTRAWAYPLGLGPGTVVVRFVRDDDVDFIPSGGEVTTVQDYIDDLKPAHATVTVIAPTSAPLDVELEITPDTVALRTSVEAALSSVLQGVGPGETVYLSAIQTAVGNVDGITDYVITDPVANVTHTSNQIATLGDVTFT